MSVPFVNPKVDEIRNCQKCGVQFQKGVSKVIASWSGKIVCQPCEKKFRAFIHLG